ncbi:hypothetical protein Sm713_13210 [Streptomyces sp. TS71-3]|nr:hypothetical protein Sm713_13210 [Streptomyces sp. TS71-3]
MADVRPADGTGLKTFSGETGPPALEATGPSSPQALAGAPAYATASRRPGALRAGHEHLPGRLDSVLGHFYGAYGSITKPLNVWFGKPAESTAEEHPAQAPHPTPPPVARPGHRPPSRPRPPPDRAPRAPAEE